MTSQGGGRGRGRVRKGAMGIQGVVQKRWNRCSSTQERGWDQYTGAWECEWPVTEVDLLTAWLPAMDSSTPRALADGMDTSSWEGWRMGGGRGGYVLILSVSGGLVTTALCACACMCVCTYTRDYAREAGSSGWAERRRRDRGEYFVECSREGVSRQSRR